MLVLGWHGGLGLAETERTIADRSLLDAAAVLMRDGVVLAAAREERFDRTPRSGAFPARSIAQCLRQAGVDLPALDAIVTDRSRESLAALLFREALNDPRLPILDPEEWIDLLFQRHFGAAVAGRIGFYDAAETRLCLSEADLGGSPSIVACIGGEDRSAGDVIAVCRGEGITVLARSLGEQSLSALIGWAEAALGLPPFSVRRLSDLAAGGDPLHFASVIGGLYRLEDGGGWTLAPENERMAVLFQTGLAGEMRRTGATWRQSDLDFAAAVHVAIERILLHVLGHARIAADLGALSLVGPLADDGRLVGKLGASGLFSRIRPYPVTDAAGGALGAAHRACRDAGCPRIVPSRDYCWGSEVGNAETIGARLAKWNGSIATRRMSDVPRESAALLARGLGIGWAQGCSEFLRQPLGSRAILRMPRTLTGEGDGESRPETGAQAAGEEPPLMVAVLRECVDDYFLVPPDLDLSAFLTVSLATAAAYRDTLAAALCPDHAALVHLVDAAAAGRLPELLAALRDMTGTPLLFAAPLGNEGEPPAETIDDALACLLAGDLDALVLDDWLVEPAPSFVSAACVDLAMSLPPGRQVSRWRGDGGWRSVIDHSAGGAFAGPPVGISAAVAGLLSGTAAAAGGDRADRGAELYDLWRRRAITLAPA